MKISRSVVPNKEKRTVKRILLIVAAALLFVNTLVVPTVVHADGGFGNVGSGGGRP
jgi:hypothetical protein